MTKQMFRITYRSEIYIEADDFQDARSKFQNMDNDEMKQKSEFVEFVSLEDEDYNEEEN